VEEKKRSADLGQAQVALQRFEREPTPVENVSRPGAVPNRDGVDDLLARVQEIQRLALTTSHQGNSKEVAARPSVRLKLSNIAVFVFLIAIGWVGALAYSLRRSHKPASVVHVAPPSHPEITVKAFAGATTLAHTNRTVNQSDISGGKLLQERVLIYPQPALTNRIQGDVSTVLVVDETGVVSDVLISRGDPMLVQSAVGPLSHWRYSPFKVNGRPVAVNVPVTISFRLDGP
jgi:TonB family protein